MKLRLERQQELSFLEFNYMILQAYDFVELYRRYGCVLQMGGSDQWGNIVSGIDLGRRLHGAQFFALTAPLITTAAGAKMGKTAAGAVWLNRRHGEPVRVLAVLAQHRRRRRRPLPEVVHRRCRSTRSSGWRRSKAARSTKPRRCWPPRRRAWCTARAAAEEAAETARKTFEEGSLAETLPTITMREHDIRKMFFEPDGLPILIATQFVGFARSSGEARRLIEGGGLKVNDATVTRILAKLKPSDLTPQGVIKLSLGRKRHVLLKPE